jgi:hypothetical protein
MSGFFVQVAVLRRAYFQSYQLSLGYEIFRVVMKWEHSGGPNPSEEEEEEEEGKSNRIMVDVRICEVEVNLAPFRIGS